MTFADILPPRSWRRWLAIAAVALLVLYSVAGFFVIPSIARPRVEALVADYVGKPVKIGSMRLNPFAISVSVYDFEIEEDGGSPVISFDELYANLRVLSLFRLDVALDAVHLEAPRVRLVLDKKGNLNLAQLFAGEETAAEPPSEEAAADEELFPISIGSVTIDSGLLVFRDETPAKPFELLLDPVHLELLGFDTRRDHKGTHVISAQTENGGTLQWTGDISVDPLRAEGDITLDKISARTLESYLEGNLPFAATKGLLRLQTKYLYDDSAGGKFTLGPGELDLESLELRETKDSPPFLTLPQLHVAGVNVDFDKSNVSVASVSSKQARATAWLAPDGALGPQALFGEPADDGGGETIPPGDDSESSWSVSVGKIAIDEYAIGFEDRSFADPFVFTIEPIDAKVEHLSLDPGEKAKVNATLKLPEEGRVEATGTLGLTPLAVDLQLQVEGVGLDSFQPYVSRFAKVEVESGSAGIDGQLTVSTSDDGIAIVEYKGAATVRDLSTLDTTRSEDLIKWAALELKEIAYISQPPALHVSEAIVEQPYARIVINKNSQLNLAELSVQESAEAKASPEEAPGGREPSDISTSAGDDSEMSIAIDTLRISKGNTDFADYSIEPSVDTGIVDLDGEILGLSSDPSAKSKVSLAGSVGQHAPAKISGSINPFNPLTQTDIEVSFDDVSLTIFTPYSARFLGYRIKKGKASVDLKYQVEDGRLKAQNEVVLDQLTLGKRVESPEATSLPVAFAVALLKDRSGRITLNLPVRGNLDDPEFSYSRIFAQTFFDLIKKTVASPFSVLGALTDFSSEELKYVDFAPGEATLDEEQTKKIDAISQALKERPALRLEVSGGVDRLADATALADLELTKTLKRAKKAELKADGQPAPKKLSAIELSDEEYDRLFDEKYEEQFGTDAPRNEQGELTDAARQALAGSFEIDDAALRSLAKKRADAIQNRIVENGIDTDRVFLVEGDLLRTKDEGEVRSELTLTG